MTACDAELFTSATEDVAYNIKMGATWLTSFLFVFFQMMTLEFSWEWVSVWSYRQLFLLF